MKNSILFGVYSAAQLLLLPAAHVIREALTGKA